MFSRRKKHPWWAPGGIAGIIMDAKGEWIQEGGKWVWVKKEDLAAHENEKISESYESPSYLSNVPGEPAQPKPKPVPVAGMPLPPDVQLAGRYQSPSYLKTPPPPVERGIRAPAPAPSPPPTPKLGSVAPTIISHKLDTPTPRAVVALTKCPMCNGRVQDGECQQCSSKQCRGCGEMNFSMSKTCFRCGHAL